MKFLCHFHQKRLRPSFLRKTTRLSIVITVLIAVLFIPHSAQAQHSEEEAILKLIRSGTLGYYGKKADEWQNSWLKDPEVSRSFIGNNGFTNTRGWENFWPGMEKYFMGDQDAVPIELTTENTIIYTADKLAWVEYDQIIKVPSRDPSYRHVSREHRVLVKEGGKWKIVSQITINTESFADSPEAIAGSLNATGHKLLRLDKSKDAIEVFRVSTQINPKSSYAFHGLAEAYAQDGSVKLAIRHYEKAIQLNPDNENAKTALAKLQ